jgi:integrase
MGLKPEERERLMKVLTGRRAHVRPMVIVCLNLGLRRGELLTLRLENVDFHRDLVVVNGKTGEREVPLNSTARSVLKELSEAAKAKGWEYLFTNPNTGTRYKHLKHSFTDALSDAEIEDFRFHDLRHVRNISG